MTAGFIWTLQHGKSRSWQSLTGLAPDKFWLEILIPAPNPCDVIGPAHLPIAGVAICLQDAGKTVEQANRHAAGAGRIVGKQDRGLARWAAPGQPHPLVRLGRFAILLQDLDARFIGLQVIAAVLDLSHQVNQGPEHLIQPYNPVRHAGSANLVAEALEHLLLPVQRQAIGVLGGDDVSQQGGAGNALAQWVRRALRGEPSNSDIDTYKSAVW